MTTVIDVDLACTKPTFVTSIVVIKNGTNKNGEQECPTLWRLYEYFTDKDKDHTIRVREERKHLSLGQGGEGYIASDEWCYNCGSCGHWGDVRLYNHYIISKAH